jgi:2-polyprenyl-3-methyl-5-hydroxy-6-metoxy-1,4-benzoquinol methylase
LLYLPKQNPSFSSPDFAFAEAVHSKFGMSNSHANPTDYCYFNTEASHINTALLPVILKTIARLQPATILDLGCGNGYLANQIQSHFPNLSVHGLEPSTEGITLAAAAFPKITFRQASLYDPPPNEWLEAFDVVICTEVIEHLYRPAALVEFATSVLRPGGTMLLSTPYHGYLKNLALSITNKWDFHFTALWDHGHIKFWSKKTLSALLELHGYHPKSFVGVGRAPFFWKTMFLEFQRSVD